MTDLHTAAMKLALNAFSMIAGADNLDWIQHQAAQQAAALSQALAEQPAQQQEQSNKSLWMDCTALAGAIHYPDCWDTGAYPELDDALHELAAWFKVSGCTTCAAQPAQQEPNWGVWPWPEKPAEQPAPVQQEPVADEKKYRLLEHGDRIESGDTVLDSDSVTWHPLSGWEIGMRWGGNLMPMRRPIEAAHQIVIKGEA